MEYFWFVMILVLSFIELITINLVTVWFVASAIVAWILSFFDIPFAVQFAVFVVLGIVLLITTRKQLTKWLNKTKHKTNLDRVLEMTGVVTKEITKNENGEVKVDGKRWTAVADKKIEVGATVKILRIDGVKLVVEEEKD
ncbi:MAG: NfeD family protein [Bacilli bacterium]|nr:NfeD family protein [Bacilli bacterium]